MKNTYVISIIQNIKLNTKLLTQLNNYIEKLNYLKKVEYNVHTFYAY